MGRVGSAISVAALALAAFALALAVRNHAPEPGPPPAITGIATQVCGLTPHGTTTWDALGSPYVICPSGIYVGQTDYQTPRHAGHRWLEGSG